MTLSGDGPSKRGQAVLAAQARHIKLAMASKPSPASARGAPGQQRFPRVASAAVGQGAGQPACRPCSVMGLQRKAAGSKATAFSMAACMVWVCRPDGHGSRRGQTGTPSVDKPVDKRCSVSPGRGQWLKEEAWGRGCRRRLLTGTHSSGLWPPAVSIRTRSGVMGAEAPGNESFTGTVACRTGLGSLWSLCGLFRLVFLRRYDSMESWLHKVCVARYGTNVPIVIAWRRAIGKNADTSRIKWAIVASDSDRCIHQRVLQVRSARWPRS